MAFFPQVDDKANELRGYSDAKLRAHRELVKQSCIQLLYQTIGEADKNKR